MARERRSFFVWVRRGHVGWVRRAVYRASPRSSLTGYLDVACKRVGPSQGNGLGVGPRRNGRLVPRGCTARWSVTQKWATAGCVRCAPSDAGDRADRTTTAGVTLPVSGLRTQSGQGRARSVRRLSFSKHVLARSMRSRGVRRARVPLEIVGATERRSACEWSRTRALPPTTPPTPG